MKTRIILALILTLMFAGNATATGYVGGTASHTTLYTDTIRGKAGATVAVNDAMVVTSGVKTAKLSASDSDSGVEGRSSASIVGMLGTLSAGVYGKNGGTIASMATANEAAIGTHSGGNVGRLGTNAEGVKGTNSNGNEGVLGTAGYGVWGKNSAASSEGYIAGASYGVYGSGPQGVRGANGNNYGYLGDINYGIYGTGPKGVYGKYISNSNYGYLGDINYGVYGSYNNGNKGYIGSFSYGVRGDNANGNYGILGGSTYGVKGGCIDAGCTYGLYTSDKAYAGNGVAVGGAAQCTDYTPGPGSSSGNCALNDIAEDIYSKDELESGDVVVIDENNNEHVRLSSKPYDTLAAGIISSSPAFHIQTSGTGIPLALAGRVKAKASAENGAIKRGDLLTTSSTPGHVMRCDDKVKCIGAIVGKAMEPLAKGKGKIAVLVALG